MILLQILSMIGENYAEYYTTSNIWYNICFYIGFYLVGIVGIILLIFGISTYNKGLRSQLILHTKSRKLHTVIKWVAFVITVLLFVYYLKTFITDLNIYTFLMIFSTLSFALYLLLYLYKKPSCLFSTSLIFIGIAYLYDLIGNMSIFLLDLPELDYYVIMVIFRIIPRLIAGILYIVLAAKLYKENFSVEVVKIIGWLLLSMEILSGVLFPMLIYSSYYFYAWVELFHVLFTIGLFLYISVFKINTLEEQVIDETKEIFVSSKSINTSKIAQVKHCTRCNNKLQDDDTFCSRCGKKVIADTEEQYEIVASFSKAKEQ